MSATVTTHQMIEPSLLPIDTWAPSTADPDYEFEYIDIASIDRDTKQIAGTTRTLAADAPSRARQIVRADDVLVSTVRPNLNAVARVPNSLDGAIASTGFCVLRCHPQKLEPGYLFHWVRTPHFVGNMVRQATGASYPAVTDRIIKETKIPLPYANDPERSLREQKRIAAILDKADAIRRKRQEACRLLKEVVRSEFLDLVGDPSINPKHFPTATLNEVFEIRTGKLDANAAVEGGRYPFFTCSRDNFAIDVSAFDCEALILSGNNASADYSVKHFKGQFNAYQRTYVLCLKDAAHSYSFFKELLEYKLNEMKHGSRGTNTKYLTLEFFKRFDLPVPPPEIQKHFEKVAGCQATIQERLIVEDECDDLFNSLVQRAFKGEL